MAKHERDRVAVGEQSSQGQHGGNRGGDHDRDHDKDDRPQRSNPSAGKDPHRGGRPKG